MSLAWQARFAIGANIVGTLFVILSFQATSSEESIVTTSSGYVTKCYGDEWRPGPIPDLSAPPGTKIGPNGVFRCPPGERKYYSMVEIDKPCLLYLGIPITFLSLVWQLALVRD